MNSHTSFDRIIASIVVFILTFGAMLIGIGVFLMVMEYGAFLVGIGILTLLLLAKFSWEVAEKLLKNGY